MKKTPSSWRKPGTSFFRKSWIPVCTGMTAIVAQSKNCTGLNGIEIDLSHHRVEVVELFLLAQLLHEFDVDTTSVEITIEIEQMRFEQRFGAVHGRPYAKAGNTGQR